MAEKPNIAPELLRQLLRYEPETGKLFWRERPDNLFEEGKHDARHTASCWNSKLAGKRALSCLNSNGYYRGRVLRRSLLAHRVIWAMEHGEWPRDQIDHTNGVRTDNRLANLRESNHLKNGKNIKKKCTNTSGHTGVYWVAARNRWHSEITVNNNKISLGNHVSIELAVKARLSAEKKYGFSHTHGKRE